MGELLNCFMASFIVPDSTEIMKLSGEITELYISSV